MLADLEAHIKLIKTITDNATAALLMMNKSGFCTFMNPAAEQMFGYSFEEISAKPLHYMIHHHRPDGSDYPLEECPLDRALPQNFEMRAHKDLFFRKDGSSFPVLCAASPIFENGEPVSTVIEVRDITEQQKYEAEIQQLLKNKDEFLSIASHELKTPLTSAKAYLQVAITKLKEDFPIHLIANSLKQVDRLQRLIADLLDVSKINSGQLPYNLSDLNFSELLKSSIANLQQTISTHQLHIRRNDVVTVNGDPSRLEQVIDNLILNAVKYSPDADEVIIDSYVDDNNLVVSIQDFGIGIEQQNLNKIFDRYYRVDNTAAKYQGLGLGLYISSEIVKRHNGSFWIESEPGKGSTFFFLIPLPDAEVYGIPETDHQTFYVDRKISIQLNVEDQYLSVDWKGYQNLQTVQHGCMIMLDLLSKNKISKVLNDNTHVKGNWSEAADWGNDFWFPAMQAAGLRYFAWIYSPSTFAQLAAHKSIDLMIDRITAQFFTDVPEATNWLVKQV